MSQVCPITGKHPLTGCNVSHSHRRTKRRFQPNLHKHRIWLEKDKRFIVLRVSTKGLRTIDKKGIETILADIANYQADIEVAE